MDTKYAPAERLPIEEILQDYNNLISVEYLTEVVNAFPTFVAILNKQRQVLLANNKFIESVGALTVEELLGLRPGEILKCINSSKEKAGCGTSDNCHVCGAVQAILQSQKSNKKIEEECRITSFHKGEIINYDFLVVANPFYYQDKTFTLLTLEDISADKRKLSLERIFFHDVINKAGSLNGFLELLNDEEEAGKIKELLKTALDISNDLTDEISAQRQLMSAENSELSINPTLIVSSDILNTLVNQMKYHQCSLYKTINIDSNSVVTTLFTDFTIFKRVLMNMLKNALEATRKNESVNIGCSVKDKIVIFWVHNSTFIEHDAQLQIFQRSFSTKGMNRGLGTYSIKLLTEKYLKGKVWFNSEKLKGTTFFVELPISI